MVFGILLIIIGVLLLLSQLGWIAHLHFWGYIWPALIIAIGVNMLAKRSRQTRR